jgi:hypothetical protein
MRLQEKHLNPEPRLLQQTIDAGDQGKKRDARNIRDQSQDGPKLIRRVCKSQRGCPGETAGKIWTLPMGS